MCAWLYATRIPALKRYNIVYDPHRPSDEFRMEHNFDVGVIARPSDERKATSAQLCLVNGNRTTAHSYPPYFEVVPAFAPSEDASGLHIALVFREDRNRTVANGAQGRN